AIPTPGRGPVPYLFPSLPAARGKEMELLDRAQATSPKLLQPLPGPLVVGLVILFPTNPFVTYLNAVEYNKSNLRGNRFTAAISQGLNFVATEPLDWPNEPPRPMLLTDQPSLDPAAIMDVKESATDLSKVRKHLQYLAIATGKMSRGSKIGGEKFLNVAPYQSLTYAEADVYNPTKWSMFEQNWRVKLAPSVVLTERFNEIVRIIGLKGVPQSLNGLAFANNH